MEHQQYMLGDLGHFLIICGCVRHIVRHTWRIRHLVLYRLMKNIFQIHTRGAPGPFVEKKKKMLAVSKKKL